MDEQEFENMVRRSFNEAAEGYDQPALRFFDNGAKFLADGLSLNGNEKILDAATGTGKVALALAERLSGGSVVGMDLSEGMLNRARQKSEERGLSNVRFEAGDVQEPVFDEHSFDGLSSGFGVFFWKDMEATLSKLVTLIKPGGFFAMTSFADGSFSPQSDLCLDRFKDYGVEMPKTYTWERLDSHQKHNYLCNAVGLTDIKSQTSQMGYYLNDADDWWNLVMYTGFRSFWNKLSDEQKARYKSEHLQEIERTRDAEGIFLNVQVILTTARKQ